MLAIAAAEPHHTSGAVVSLAEPDVCAPIDANGNLTSDGTRSFSYDARDLMRSVTVGSDVSEFSYDVVGRVAAVAEKQSGVVVASSSIIWCGIRRCEERSTGTALNRRFFSNGAQVGTDSRYIAVDHLGSPREVLDSSSSLLTRYSYGPWGDKTTVTGSDSIALGFTGHSFHPTTGLTLAPFRAYDDGIGRWLTEDPLRELGGPNRYAYVQGQTINSTDPTGLFAPTVVVVPIWAAVAIVGLAGKMVYDWWTRPPNDPNNSTKPKPRQPTAPEPIHPPDEKVVESPYPKDNPKECDNKYGQRWACRAKGHLTPFNIHPNPTQTGFIVYAMGYGPNQHSAAEAAKDNCQSAVPPHYTRGWWYVRHCDKYVPTCWRLH